MKFRNIIEWVLRIAAAVILLQTLYFKFTGHPESVELFSKLGVEPWGRIGTGVIELVTGVLLLIPSTACSGSFIRYRLNVRSNCITLVCDWDRVKGRRWSVVWACYYCICLLYCNCFFE